MKWLVLIVGGTLGYLLIRYSRQLVNMFGQIGWAERKFGPGGSMTWWKIIGIVVVAYSLLNFTGQIAIIGNFFASIFAPEQS